ncbi:hypothetical protein ACVMHY_005993 [Bradyrhizobium barranii subsp. barranii]
MVAATLEARCEGSLSMMGMIETGADSSAGGDGGIIFPFSGVLRHTHNPL